MKTEQDELGFQMPDGMMFIGVALGVKPHDGTQWTRFQLGDGREIGIAATDDKVILNTAINFLWNEKVRGREFTNEDTMEFEGVRVAYLNFFDQDKLTTSPWSQTRKHDWTWPVLMLLFGIGLYAAIRSLGWVIDGFFGGARTHQP